MTCRICSKYYFTKKIYDSNLVWAYKDEKDRIIIVLKQHSDSFPTCSGAREVRNIYDNRLRPDSKFRKPLQQILVDGHLVIVESDIDTLSC
jgi:hypothetical protein